MASISIPAIFGGEALAGGVAADAAVAGGVTAGADAAGVGTLGALGDWSAASGAGAVADAGAGAAAGGGIGTGAAILGAGALGAGANLLGGTIGSKAATDAGKIQAAAANRAADIQTAEFNTVRDSLQPFISAGQGNINNLATNIGALVARFNPTIADLESTPGYKFTLDQGLKATQNSYAGRGLASSGAAMKGAANYAEGLAGTTYQQQFQNYLGQNQQIYSMLSGIAGLGENAAAGSGQIGAGITSNITNLLTGGAAAQAAGTVGSANAITGAATGLAGSASNTGLLMALNNAGLFGTGANA